MSDEPIKLSEVSSSALHWSVEEMLREILDNDLNEFQPNKAIVILTRFNSTPGDDEIEFRVIKAGTNDLEASGILQLALHCRAEKLIAVE